MVDEGRFTAAEARIAELLAMAEDDADLRRALEFQRERMRRIRLDFPLDEAAAKAAVRKQAPDVSNAEFAAWDREGLIERIEIDGEKRYFNRAVFNLFRLVPEAAARRAPPVRPFSQGPYEVLHPHHEEVLAAAKDSGATSVAPRRVRITQSLTVDADAVPAGETVRAWIPYPRAIPGQQEDIRLVDSVPTGARIAPESAPQRTAYLERPAVAGEPTRFSASYELTIHARHFDIDPDRVVAAEIDASLAPYVAERPPHVVFTDAMRAYSRKVVGDETNPYRIAQKLFAAVDEIPWGGAREYSTLSNIGDHALHADHADCGQVTLLLVTLLRMNGIPARWQSGWTFSDDDVGYDNMHDWGWLYLAPYGWVPMDVTTGQLESDDPALRWFYLGGLDASRIAFNDDWSQPFVPPKRHFRSETVDSQRGEAEWDGGNLYFDQWDYDFEWQVLPPATDERT
ncbi:transglutaminase-like domain-containing protein [Luteimonas salinilitoris]|uniref:Transglutaminase-like domain-containing protein n=1 Tax=Luteimonas salinilitoris TaxID=3237697 RepID=A0ABV4HSS4_9GAMM